MKSTKVPESLFCFQLLTLTLAQSKFITDRGDDGLSLPEIDGSELEFAIDLSILGNQEKQSANMFFFRECILDQHHIDRCMFANKEFV